MSKLYGEFPAVLTAALLHVVRNEVPLGKALVAKARSSATEFTCQDFSGLTEILGQPAQSTSALTSFNDHVQNWLLGNNTEIPQTLPHLFERFYIETVIHEPESLSDGGLLEQVGISGHNAEWSNSPSPAHTELKRALFKNLSNCLAHHKEIGVDKENAISFQVMNWMVESELKSFEFEDHFYAVEQMEAIHSSLVYFLNMLTPVNTMEDAENYVKRVKAIPQKLDLVCKKFEQQKKMKVLAPKVCLERCITSIEEIRKPLKCNPKESPIYSFLASKLAGDDFKDEDQDKIKTFLRDCEEFAQGNLESAYGVLEDAIRDAALLTITPSGVGSLPKGKEFYEYCLQYHTSTDKTANEIHELGLNEVATLRSNIQNVLERLSKSDNSIDLLKSPIENLRKFNENPKFLYEDSEIGKKQVISDFEALVAEIDQLISPIFDIRPKTAMEIQPVPSYMEDGAPAAFYMPPSIDGSRPGVFAANLGDMKAILKYGMRTLTAHEAIPGHHFQIALANEMEGLPYFRRSTSGFTAFVEGWGLYAERLAQEVGFYKTESDGTEGYDLLGHYADELLRASRLVVDTGLHTFNWSREKAINYMRENTNLAESDLETEVDRYCVLPGQATAYKVGQLKIFEERASMKERLGEDFDLKEFHRLLLLAGAIPLDIVEKVLKKE